MRAAHEAERETGVLYYVSETDGTGGRLRADPESFRVRELERLDLADLTADPGDYNHLVIRAELRDWDTNDFARAIANRLEMSRERISWAGTKDKRAITTQLFSLTGVDPDALPTVSGATIEPIGRLGRPLEFGDLVGNAFEVTVTDPTHPERARRISAELEAFAGENGTDAADGTRIGVPNYFGHQRFGSIRPVTHAVGRRIIRRDWEGAVMAYLGSPTEAEPADTQAARAYVEETRDWAEAAERFPAGLRFERTLCHRLAAADGETTEAFRGALDALPWNLRRLFVNAAQSEAYNRMLSARLERGLPFDQAVVGDVVCFTEQDAGIALPDPSRSQRVTGGRLDTVNRHVQRNRAFVTAPLVGTETELAEGVPGDIEREVLDQLELAPSDFDLPDPYHSSGTRRAILLRTGMEATTDPLMFRFELPPGAYATVVLREYLKVGPRSL